MPFMMIAPNIIVLERIYKDFSGVDIFFKDPVLPDNEVGGRNWRRISAHPAPAT
jgi:type III restriction enzyme